MAGSALSGIALYAATQNFHYLFDMHCNGLAGVMVGLAVAFKQAHPQWRLEAPGGLVVESRIVPGLLVLAALAGGRTGLLPPSATLVALHGGVGAWAYLRFYQVLEGRVGDPTEAFAFADFFPSALQPFVGAVAAQLHRIVSTLGLCRRSPATYDLGADNLMRSSTLPPGSARTADAERRRLKAERDLKARLDAAAAGGGGGKEEAGAAAAASGDGAQFEITVDIQS